MNYKIVPIVLTAVVVLAGCGYVPQGEVVSVGLDGSVSTSGSEFRIEGDLTTGGGISDRDTYRNVSLELYSKSGELLLSNQLGDLSSVAGRINASVRTEKIPHYVIFTSPDFWTGEVEVEYYVRREAGYAVEYATSESELPVSANSVGTIKENEY